MLNLERANKIADVALEEGRRRKLKPLCVVVVDTGGHPIVVKREDDANFLRPKIATAKAAGCAGTGLGGRELARRALIAPGAFAGLIAATGGRLIGAAGGVLIRDASGEMIGAVGVSGDASEEDEACAVEAIVSVGFIADTGASAAP